MDSQIRRAGNSRGRQGESTPIFRYASPMQPPDLSPRVYHLQLDVPGLTPDSSGHLLRVRSNALAVLHAARQIVFAWSDGHLHGFRIHGQEYGSTRLGGFSFDVGPRHTPKARASRSCVRRSERGRRPGVFSGLAESHQRAVRRASPASCARHRGTSQPAGSCNQAAWWPEPADRGASAGPACLARAPRLRRPNSPPQGAVDAARSHARDWRPVIWHCTSSLEMGHIFRSAFISYPTPHRFCCLLSQHLHGVYAHK